MVVAFFTVWATLLEVLVARFAVPLYIALMEWVPPLNAEVVNVAVPALSAPVPMVVAPSLKVTLPVGVPTPDVTFEVNVTACPKIEGFRDEATVVAVGAGWCVGQTLTLEQASIKYK